MPEPGGGEQDSGALERPHQPHPSFGMAGGDVKYFG
jgi:hypothetical protein